MSPTNLSVEHRLAHDLRSVDDMARLKFGAVEKDAAQWVVVRLHPDAHSGASTNASKVIDGTTGEVIDRPGLDRPGPGKTVIVVKGRWEAIGRLTGQASEERGEYSWTEPPKYRLQQLTASDVYSPFEKGGIVLCRHDSAADSGKQFEPVFLLPANWDASVQPAYEYFRRYRAIFDKNATKGTDHSLKPVVLGGNPILSVMALCLTLAAGSLSPELFSAASHHGDYYLQAAVLYATLLALPADVNRRLVPELQQRFAAPATIEEQRAAGLALLARMLLNQVAVPAGDREALLWQTFRSGATGIDPYIAEIFRQMGG